MSKLSKDTQQRIVISLTSESAGKELIDAIEGGKVLSGSEAPSDSLGENGDLYVNITNGDLYKKYNSSWSLQESGGGGDFANKDLSNLTPTAIPAGVNLESLNTSTVFTTGFQIKTKTQTTSNSGAIRVISGDVTGNFTSGGARVWSGWNFNAQRSNSNTFATGTVSLLSGSIVSGIGSTGNILLNTGGIEGVSSQGNTGPVAITTGINAGIGNTGEVSLASGNASQGNSGNINIGTGFAQGAGTTGEINIISGASNNSNGALNTTIATGSTILTSGDITGGIRGTTGNSFVRSGSIDFSSSATTYTGNTGIVGSNSGEIRCGLSGATVEGSSGLVYLGSGAVITQASGASIVGGSGGVGLGSGSITSASGSSITGDSGSGYISSGNILGSGTTNSSSGHQYVYTGAIFNTNNTGNTGNIEIFSNNNYGTGNSGNVYIYTGSVASGARGYISLAASYINANFTQIKDVANATDPSDAVNLSQLETITNDLEDRVVSLEDNSNINTVYAYEDNLQVRADGQPGVKDPSPLIRDGWYYKNLVAGQKINWYYFDGLNQGTVTLGDLKSVYAVMTFDAVRVPILAIYTVPTGVGDALPLFAHSRIVYDATMTPTPVVGKKYLVYGGEEPSVHPELPRIQLALVPAQSIGEQLPAEQILTVSFGSDSGASVNSVQYMVETLGLFSDPVKHEMDLRIRVGSQLELDNKANRDLSNLVATAIPAGVNLESVGSAFSVKTKDQTTATSGEITLKSGEVSSLYSGNVLVSSGSNSNANGATSLSQVTGTLDLWTGDINGGVKGLSGGIRILSGYILSSNFSGYTGSINIESGIIDSTNGNGETGGASLGSGAISKETYTGNTGVVRVYSGLNNGFGNTGEVSVRSGGKSAMPGSPTGNTGVININSGNNASIGNSGNVNIYTGTVASGTRGFVSLDGSYITVNSKQIKDVADGTANNDAVNVSQLTTLQNKTIVGQFAMPLGADTFSVTGLSIGTTNYIVNITIENIIDATIRHLVATVTAKTATSFNFTTPQTTDHVNYKANYIINKL